MIVKRKSSAVYEIAHHIVWCPEYWKDLPLDVQNNLKTVIHSVVEARELMVGELKIRPENVHSFIESVPRGPPMGIVKAWMGISVKLLFKEHPILRTIFRKGHLWNPRHYIGTFGHVSGKTVARYFRDQRSRRVGRPTSTPQ